jgi:hypothetical protein
MRRKVLVGVAALLAAVVSFAAESLMIGTWKLNEAKSKFVAGTTKNSTVIYTATGDNIKCSIDGIDPTGKPYHSDWTGKFDGKPYPLTGDPEADMRSYRMVNDHTFISTNMKGGKTTITARIVISPDGKSRTVTVTNTDAAGAKHTSSEVFDKQ